MKNLIPYLLVSIIALPASARTYDSEFGIRFDAGKDWLVLGKQQIAKQNQQATLEALKKIGIKQEKAEKVFARIQGADIEFLFDRQKTSDDFHNNISLQRGAGATARTSEQAEAACKTLEPELQKMYKEKIAISQCGLIKVDGHEFMSYEYRDAIPGVTTIQHEFQITPNLTMITIGGSKQDAVKRTRATQMKIAKAIVAYIKSSPDFFKLSEEAARALQQEKYDTAFKHIKTLSDAGDPEGLFNLAVFYEHGKVVKEDKKTAFKYYNKAARAGHRHAITKLGQFHFQGIATKKDPEMAARLFFRPD